MGVAREPMSAALFVGVLYSRDVDVREVLSLLAGRFGPVEGSHGPIPFTFSEYYKEEMGEGLRKEYCAFQDCISRGELAAAKCFTNEIESHFLVNGKRTVNLDPGYITSDKLVLASTKDFFHRVFLGRGIYAEVTLHYRQGRFRHFSWTYPDYRETGVQKLLEMVRAKLVNRRSRSAVT